MGTVADGVRTALDYVVEAESRAVLSLLKGAHTGVGGQQVQFFNRGPDPCGVGGTLWGLQAPVLRAVKRIDDPADREWAMHWMVEHVHDTVDLYWRCRAIEKRNPPGEGCRLEGGVVTNYDSDILRHTDVAGLIDCARDHELQAIGLDVERVRAVALDWGAWLRDKSWHRKMRETHRFGLPINSLVAIYEMTEDPTWLNDASNLMRYGWGDGTARDIVTPDGGKFTSWDSGYPWDDRGFMAGDCTTYPWYEGDMACAFLRFWPHASDADKGMMADRVLKVSDWYVSRDACAALGDVSANTPDAFRDVRNTPMHGGLPGNAPDGWFRGGLPHVHDLGRLWAQMDAGAEYWPIRCLYWLEVDGLYWDSDHGAVERPGVTRKRHRPLLGPSLAWDWKGLADLFFARYLVTGRPEDRTLAVWALFDYKAWADYQGGRTVSKAKAPADWWAGAFGRARGLAWRIHSGWMALDTLLVEDV